MVGDKTGLLLDPYFSATKLAWPLAHLPGARRRAEGGDLCFGTVDSYLLFRLTGGAVHATDVLNASRTLLFDIHTPAWDENLLRLFDIPLALLPEVRPNSHLFGATEAGLFGAPIPIAGMAGDQRDLRWPACRALTVGSAPSSPSGPSAGMNLRVLHGGDLIKQVYLWDPGAVAYVLADPATFGRFCAADLPGQLYFYRRPGFPSEG